MECKEFEKMIPSFLEQKMDYDTLKEFRSHIYSCENCKEELTIQFLVTEGIQRLEKGDAFDLRKELDFRLTEAKKKLVWYRHMRKITLGLEIAAILFFVLAVVWMMI